MTIDLDQPLPSHVVGPTGIEYEVVREETDDTRRGDWRHVVVVKADGLRELRYPRRVVGEHFSAAEES